MAGLIGVRANINRSVLDGVIAKLPAGQDFLAETAADVVLEKAKANAPVRTGALRDSGEKRGSGSIWIVAFTVLYAIFQEFGTRFMAAHPYLRPALESTRWSDVIRKFFERIGLK